MRGLPNLETPGMKWLTSNNVAIRGAIGAAGRLKEGLKIVSA